MQFRDVIGLYSGGKKNVEQGLKVTKKNLNK